MRRILDTLRRIPSLAAQLRKTWLTAADPCAAEVSDGKHVACAKQACAQTYISRQSGLLS
jgi:hypothetical protein